MPHAAYARQANLLKVLAHPVRLQIAEILSQREACVCHLVAMLRLRQAYVSQQLMVFRKAGLLHERREGTFIFYRLKERSLRPLLVAVRQAAGGQPLEAIGERLDGCACPRCEGVA